MAGHKARRSFAAPHDPIASNDGPPRASHKLELHHIPSAELVVPQLLGLAFGGRAGERVAPLSELLDPEAERRGEESRLVASPGVGRA